ncbi:hypothetical protein O3M35_003095 [Rhynocoris fuscipes]|uniref:ANK_REP_REGION domain-containing protein n=1 Tax=Rhynocoris fuscipes TaxID=488301 RepID=A0AAW1CLV6_9HEMI
MLSARAGLCTIVKVLLENGACLETSDSNGWTAEDYAQFGGHQDLIDLLKVQKKEESNLDQSDKLSVQSSDPSENINCFEVVTPEVIAPDDQQDSPKSCVIPPALEPPRSWDLIQSGVMDQEGSECRKKNLITLPGLKKDVEPECEFVVTPVEYNPSVLSPMTDVATLEMRLSPEPCNRDLMPTPERRARSPLERANSLDLPSDQDSPIQVRRSFGSEKTYLSNGNDDKTNNGSNMELDKQRSDEEKPVEEILPNKSENNATIHTIISTNSCSSFIMVNKPDKNKEGGGEAEEEEEDVVNKTPDINLIPDDSTYTIDTSPTFDKLNKEKVEEVSSTSLDNIEDIDNKSVEIEMIQSSGKLDDTILSIFTVPGKNVFRETHSLELLEENVDPKSYKIKRHCRNKSITLSGQPQFWKSADFLNSANNVEKNSMDIEAQLVCYDEAMRQLATVSTPKQTQKQQHETLDISDKSPRNERKVSPLHEEITRAFIQDRNEIESGCQTDIMNFPDPATDSDHDSLDRDSSFPPPPVSFEDFDIIHLNSEDLCPADVNLPLPISMLTPIKENHFESDSLSLIEANDGNESEGSIVNEHLNTNLINRLSKSLTPSHFNVEVTVNNGNNNNDNSPESDSPGEVQGSVSETNSDALTLNGSSRKDYTYEMDDVFIEESVLPEHYEKYFVDVKALQFQPSSVDLTKIVLPVDSPSPKTKQKIKTEDKLKSEENISDNDRRTSKFPSLNFVIGGICHVNKTISSEYNQFNKTDNESECIGGRPLRRKRKLLLAMRGSTTATSVGVGPDDASKQSSDIDNDDEEDGDEDDEDSDEDDPPFWQNTDKGGYFMRQNTVVTMSPKDIAPTMTVIPR